VKVRHLVHLLVSAITVLLLAECQIVKVTKGESNPGTLSQTRNLGFDEGEAGDGDPIAWDRRGGEPESYLFSVDSNIKRSGKSSALIRLKPDTPDPEELDTSLIQCTEPDSFIGKSFRLNGWIKTEGADGEGAALWIGAYGRSNSDAGSWFPAEDEWRRGSVDWSLYEAHTNPLPEETNKVCFGPILYGSGSAWFDDLEVVTE
jgi:hypothetical protein